MKKLLVLAVLVVAAASLVPASATHASRTVSATVALPTSDQPIGLFTRHARYNAIQGGPNDVVGHVEALDVSEGDGTHAFTLTSGADFDVVFYADLGTCDNAPAPTVTGQFSTVGNEAGTIPTFSTVAIIVFKSVGVNQSFSLNII